MSCAKVSEAEVLNEKGIRGILITSPVVTKQKIATLLKCRKLDSDLLVVVDNRLNVLQLNQAMEDTFEGELRNEKLKVYPHSIYVSIHSAYIKVLVDVDGGHHRTGVPIDQAYEFALFVAEKGNRLELAGIQCYMGNVQHITPFEKRLEASHAAMLRAQELVLQLRKAGNDEVTLPETHLRNTGLPCQIFTGSGTGTWDIDVQVKELSELQTGSYVMMDAEYLNVGSKDNPKRFDSVFQDPPLTLLTTVISNNHLPGAPLLCVLKHSHYHRSSNC